MKYNSKYNFLFLVLLLASCSKDFVDRPSENGPTLDVYYNTAAEVNAATGLLYNTIWFDWQDKAFHAIGEAQGGNMLTPNGDSNYGSGVYNNFKVQSTDVLVAASWKSLYKVAGNATVLVKTFEEKASIIGEKPYLTQGIAEARFLRAIAYFYIARTFGDVPIVEDPVALAKSGDYRVPRYIQSDVIQFIINDLKFAEEHLSDVSYQPGRVNKYSASGLMAKAYLYVQDYANAKLKAQEVINSGKFALYADYGKMFTSSAANNNSESLFALQWSAAGGYAIGNPIQIYAGPSTLLKPDFDRGYSSVLPTLDIVRAYEEGDKRRGWSIMEHGYFNPDWKNINFPDGYLYDTTYMDSNDEAKKIKNGSRCNSLKYIVGTGSNGELVNDGFSDICTYILRYSDILLIYAESILGTGNSTTDAQALDAMNQVRARAGLAGVTEITKDNILHERRVEFAFEGDYWYDVQRQGFDRAKVIIAAQERGNYNYDGTVNSIHASIVSPSQLFLPIPLTEVQANPKLNEAAVKYY